MVGPLRQGPKDLLTYATSRGAIKGPNRIVNSARVTLSPGGRRRVCAHTARRQRAASRGRLDLTFIGLIVRSVVTMLDLREPCLAFCGRRASGFRQFLTDIIWLHPCGLPCCTKRPRRTPECLRIVCGVAAKRPRTPSASHYDPVQGFACPGVARASVV